MYMQVPELPPRYKIIFEDDYEDEEYNGWYMYHDGENIPDPDADAEDEMPVADQADAVAACWHHWEQFALDDEWRKYIEYMRRADLEAARMRDYVNARGEQSKK